MLFDINQLSGDVIGSCEGTGWSRTKENVVVFAENCLLRNEINHTHYKKQAVGKYLRDTISPFRLHSQVENCIHDQMINSTAFSVALLNYRFTEIQATVSIVRES